MKNYILPILFLFSLNGFSQQEKIRVPNGVVYNYCKAKKYTKIKDLLLTELVKLNPTYKLVSESFFLGPVLWDRIGKIDSIAETSSINVDLHVDKALLKARLYRDFNSSKVVWNQIRAEFNNTPMRLRKASPEELAYYWSVISYDIDEPLIIGQTADRTYIFDIDLKSKALIWLDEMPADFKKWLKSLE
jgi:hypothetical protein